MEFTTEGNKAKVVINPAPLRDAFKLKASLEKALSSGGLKIEDALEGKIFDAIMALDSSEEVFDAIFKCLEKSSYNGIKITPEVFDSEDSRSDLYEIFFYCIKVNVYPFIKSLCSQLGIQLEMNGGTLPFKSKTKADFSV